ncbi:hypothetical protein EVAR_11893_1 [Eumeta japonica]|uniref:Uncharacterized protein n=1 Tax=Eumeta variegata TaxID=151549 RepID=A0A4C1U8D7_EUMVA|nr:hypothetical protein EVAR_11893_1 [Eumeta japonica]
MASYDDEQFRFLTLTAGMIKFSPIACGFPAFAINNNISYEVRSPSFSGLEHEAKRYVYRDGPLDCHNAPHLPLDPLPPPRKSPAPTRGRYRPLWDLLWNKHGESRVRIKNSWNPICSGSTLHDLFKADDAKKYDSLGHGSDHGDWVALVCVDVESNS